MVNGPASNCECLFHVLPPYGARLTSWCYERKFFLGQSHNAPVISSKAIRRRLGGAGAAVAQVSGRGDASVAPLSFLVYLSAGDALAALDRLGPAIGLDISREGLIR